jgi:hypothetical protein
MHGAHLTTEGAAISVQASRPQQMQGQQTHLELATIVDAPVGYSRVRIPQATYRLAKVSLFSLSAYYRDATPSGCSCNSPL